MVHARKPANHTAAMHHRLLKSTIARKQRIWILTLKKRNKEIDRNDRYLNNPQLNKFACPDIGGSFFMIPADLKNQAPVAQLDRVPGYEPGGREFESLRARQNQRVS